LRLQTRARQTQPAPSGPPEDHGDRAALPFGGHLQDSERAQRGHRRGNPRHLRGSLEDGPEVRRHLPRWIQTLTTANTRRQDQAGEEQAIQSQLAPLKQEVEQLRKQVGQPVRRRMPETRASFTHKFSIAGHEGYFTVGLFEDGQPGELFITMAKEGSTIGGLMDTIATLVSLSLQYGVPLQDLVRKFAHQRFEPSGYTANPQIRMAKSIVDYIFRWLGITFIPSYESGDLEAIPVNRLKHLYPQAATPATEPALVAGPVDAGNNGHAT